MSQPTKTFTPEALLSHTDFVRALAQSLLRDAAAAEDVTQNTLAQALERPPRAADSLGSWLRTVAANFVRQEARASGRRRHHEARAARPEALPSTAEVLEREAMRSEVVEALLALPEAQRDVLLLRFYEGKTPRDIARRLGVPVETVRTRQKRGIARMRQALDGRRSREDWMSALVPLAGVVSRTGTVLLASTLQKAAVAAVVLVLGAAWWVSRPGAPSPPTITAAETVAPQLEEDAPAADLVSPVDGARAPVASPAAPAAPIVVSGRALSPDGQPLAGASVYLSAEGPIEHPGKARMKMAYVGADRGEMQLTETSEEGAFRFVIEQPGRVHLGFVHLTDPLLYPGDGAWVDAPIADVELHAVPSRVATLAVRATHATTGEDVSGFTAVLWSTTTHSTTQATTQGMLLEAELPMAEGLLEERFNLTVEHANLGKAEEQVTLRPGERTEVQLLFEGNLEVRGVVVDQQGRPVEDALVYFGIQELLRGDEPFKPYDPGRVKNGVRTDASGTYELAGKGSWITAWHAELAPRSVPLEEAERIELPPRSGVTGTLLDDSGMPVAGASVVMDRERTATTDADGRFGFEGLEPGIRGIQLDSGRRFALEVPPAETIDVELSAGLPEVTLELQQDGLPTDLNPKDFTLLVGEGRVFSVQDKPVMGGRVQLENVLPGDYWLLCASGMIARARIDAPHVAADVGTSSLRIRAAAGRQFFLAPAAGNELVWLMANRVAQHRMPASGELVIAPLPAGTFVLGAEGEGELARVVVPAQGEGLLELE